jgi:hypothetical protein
MPAAVALRSDWDAERVRAVAREAKDADQVRRLLAIAAAYEGQDRAACAKTGAMGPQLDFGHFRPADRLGVAGHSSATLLMMPLSMAAR